MRPMHRTTRPPRRRAPAVPGATAATALAVRYKGSPAVLAALRGGVIRRWGEAIRRARIETE